MLLRYNLVGNKNWSFIQDYATNTYSKEILNTFLSTANLVLEILREAFQDKFPEKVIIVHQTGDINAPQTFKKDSMLVVTDCICYPLKEIYQLSHEVCHLAIPESVANELFFWEEVVCQTASRYVLTKIMNNPNTIENLGKNVWEYIPRYIQEEFFKESSCEAYSFLNENIADFRKNPCNYTRNLILVNDLFDLFYNEPEAWKWALNLPKYPSDISLKELFAPLKDFASKYSQSAVLNSVE